MPKESEMMEISVNSTGRGVIDKQETEKLNSPTSAEELQSPASVDEQQESKEKSCCRKMFEPFLVLVYGWRTYSKQSVVFASVALSFLYMTVLGFDSITIGKSRTLL